MSKPLNIYRLYVAAIVGARVEPADCPWEWRGSGCYDVDVYNIELWQMDIVAVHEDMAKYLAGQEVLWNPPHGTTEDWKVFRIEDITDEGSGLEDMEGVEWTNTRLMYGDADSDWCSSYPRFDEVRDYNFDF